MQCSMFGKLPSKRDFVSYNMTRPFLDHWETWLQTAVATSRLALGETWQVSFLNAPIWRFWFGADIFGQQVTGALMPSVDGVGRYFPLSVCACATNGFRLLTPPALALDQWHENCEQFLLSMLEDQLAGDPSTLLEALPFAPIAPDGVIAPSIENPATWISPSGSLDAAFASLKAMNDDSIHRRRCYWWTVGGGFHHACLIARNGSPEPEFLTQMITSKFT